MSSESGVYHVHGHLIVHALRDPELNHALGSFSLRSRLDPVLRSCLNRGRIRCLSLILHPVSFLSPGDTRFPVRSDFDDIIRQYLRRFVFLEIEGSLYLHHRIDLSKM